MSVTKQEALAAIAGLPEDVSLLTIIQRLQQLHRIQQGLRDATSLAEEQHSPPQRHGRRSPPEALRASLTIHGDILAPAIKEEDWELLR